MGGIMRLRRIILDQFRCYRSATSIEIDALTALIGRNDSGKSSILDALAIFFEDNLPDVDDVYISSIDKLIKIGCEFTDLPESIVIDADFSTNLESEYMLNEDGHFEVYKVFDCNLKKPGLKETYARAFHPTLDGINDLLTLKNDELKQRARHLEVSLEGVDQRINTALRRAIRDSRQALDLATVLVPLDKEGGKKLWDILKKQLPSFALFKSDRPSTDQDSEAQDPMKIAVKEALKARETQLEELTEYVRQEVKTIADKTIEKISEMDPNLARQLNPRFSTPSWANVFKISLTGDEDIPINKRGSGIRRLILLNFFRAKAEQRASEKDSPGVIYAIEEPETSQHPDSQRILLHALEELSEHPDCQVIISTHTPNLARLLPIESLRYVKIGESDQRIIHSGTEDTIRIVAKALGVLPDHDVELFIGVEGINDINFLKTIANVLLQAGEEVPDLDSLEGEGKIIFIPVGGSNVIYWVSRLAQLNRPEYHIFDRDAQPPSPPPNQAVVDEINGRDNCTARLTNKLEFENYIHQQAILRVHPNLTLTIEDFSSVPTIVAIALHERSESEVSWEDLTEEKRQKKISQAKSWLNREAVVHMTPQLLTEIDPDNEVRSWLTDIGGILR
jgi:putative ATP-dependent endonuclease of OLD family